MNDNNKHSIATTPSLLPLHKKTADVAEQLTLFDKQNTVNYKRAKADALKLIKGCEMLFDEYSKNKERLTFNKAQMLKTANEYIQALIICKELSKGEKADENNLQFALDISWFGNLFDSAKNLNGLSQVAKAKLLAVPDIFLTSVVMDVRGGAKLSASLYEAVKKVFMNIYAEGQNDFALLTKNLTNFLNKQGIKI